MRAVGGERSVQRQGSRGGKSAVEKADYARTFKILRDAHYQGFVALEYEFKEDPFVRVPQILEEMRPLLD